MCPPVGAIRGGRRLSGFCSARSAIFISPFHKCPLKQRIQIQITDPRSPLLSVSSTGGRTDRMTALGLCGAIHLRQSRLPPIPTDRTHSSPDPAAFVHVAVFSPGMPSSPPRLLKSHSALSVPYVPTARLERQTSQGRDGSRCVFQS